MEKLNYLILGGCGFIGRNLVSYLLSNNLANFIRVVDKVPPQVAWLNDNNIKDFNNKILEYRSANLMNEDSCKIAFQPPVDINWDIVVNCAGETKPGQTDLIYKEGIFTLSLNCIKAALRYHIKRYVELSSGNMYSDDKTPHKESDPVKPWTFVAKWKRQVEEELKEFTELPFIVLRLPVVYGLGDKNGITPRILLAALYRYLKRPMKLLWNGDMKVNTVHVQDVCRAIHFLCQYQSSVYEIYNVVDDADSTQGSISNILENIFAITVEYYGNLLSSTIDLTEVADEANDMHLEPWAEICRKDSIQNTPLSPHMDPEQLLHKHLYLDGSKLKNAGFTLDIPEPTGDHIIDIINDYVNMKVFPPTLVP